MQATTNAVAQQARDPFQSLFDHLFGNTLQDFYGTAQSEMAPRTNVSESDQGYQLVFEMPGVEEKDVEVQMHDGVLTITAERKADSDAKNRRWHRVEHRYGRFARTVALPKDANAAGIEAVYRQGVLTVNVPKTPESQPTKIQVRAN